MMLTEDEPATDYNIVAITLPEYCNEDPLLQHLEKDLDFKIVSIS